MNKIYYVILLSLYSITLQPGILDETCVVCTFGNLLTQQKSENKDHIKEVSAQELLTKININKPNPNLLIVNVLGKRFYDDCRIATSISAPFKELHIIAKEWDKNKEIIVYCACKECDASEKAYFLLRTMGFTNVAAYEGGIREWYKKGYPCEGPCAYEYLNQEGDEKKLASMAESPLKHLLLQFYWGLWA